MSKLPKNEQFLDLSDYGRPLARILVKLLFPTPIGAKSITVLFTVVGIWAIIAILNSNYLLAAILLPIKSCIDAADGEMARAKNRPSYVGRYMDSISDILLNFGLFLAIGHITHTSIIITLSAWLTMQLQGTFYNYLYVIRRHQFSGDTTSKIEEDHCPIPTPYDNVLALKLLFFMYTILYRWQDKLIIFLCPKRLKNIVLPSHLMTGMTVNGLGFQLLVMSLLLVLSPKVIFLYFFIMTLTLVIFILSTNYLSKKRTY